MKANSRRAVGNGRYCYSGPTCRIHGTVKTSQVNITPLVNALNTQPSEQFLQTAANYLQELICQFPAVKTFAELKGDAFDKELQAQYCETHDGYHVYSRKQSPTSTILPQLHAHINPDSQNAGILRSTVKRLNGTILAPSSRNDKETADKLRAEYGRTAEGQAYAEARNNGYSQPTVEALNRLLQKPQKQASQAAGPLLPAETLTDEQAVEFWDCGRKTPYSTPAAALERFQTHQTAAGITYKCEYCHQYHAAHKTARTVSSDYHKIRSAKAWWNSHPDKANQYAFRKKLI